MKESGPTEESLTPEQQRKVSDALNNSQPGDFVTPILNPRGDLFILQTSPSTSDDEQKEN